MFNDTIHLMEKFKNKKSAFTLAEVLITLGIIGVVAAMTIPTLINKINDAQYKSGFKKIYAELNQARLLMQQQDKFSFDTLQNFWIDLGEKLGAQKVCVDSITEGCWHKLNEFNNMNNLAVDSMNDLPGIITKNGILITTPTSVASATGEGIYSNGATYLTLLVDTNGFDKPNRVGYDIQNLDFLATKLIPGGNINSYYNNPSYCSRTIGASNLYRYGCACANNIILNIDY